MSVPETTCAGRSSCFLDGRRSTERDLRALAEVPNETALRISGLRITLRALASVPWITSLTLDDPATLDGLEALQQVRKLAVDYFPKVPHVLCPDCNRARIEKHIEAWKAVVGGV